VWAALSSGLWTHRSSSKSILVLSPYLARNGEILVVSKMIVSSECGHGMEIDPVILLIIHVCP
jgi:hypothetical protein